MRGPLYTIHIQHSVLIHAKTTVLKAVVFAVHTTHKPTNNKPTDSTVYIVHMNKAGF